MRLLDLSSKVMPTIFSDSAARFFLASLLCCIFETLPDTLLSSRTPYTRIQKRSFLEGIFVYILHSRTRYHLSNKESKDSSTNTSIIHFDCNQLSQLKHTPKRKATFEEKMVYNRQIVTE